MPDEDGYPTEEELKKIETWEFQKGADIRGFMEYIRPLWSYPDRFSCKPSKDIMGKPCLEYYLSTGGWSGNENIIEAMEKNTIFWMMCWKQSQRGGHYLFEIREE